MFASLEKLSLFSPLLRFFGTPEGEVGISLSADSDQRAFALWTPDQRGCAGPATIAKNTAYGGK